MKSLTFRPIFQYTLVLALIAIAAPLSAWVYHGSDINFTGGIRCDYIRSTSKALSPQGKVLFYKKIQEDDIELYTMGINGRYEFGEECCSIYTWANHFFVRGHANLGWIGSSRYHEDIVDSYGRETKIRARQHKGRTQDFQAGLGYLGIVCNECLRIGPIVGYSYNLQRFTTKLARRDLNPFRPDDGTAYRTRWRGPFLGLDVVFHECKWSLELGYEFHWAKLQAFWDPKHDIPYRILPEGHFKNHQKADHAFANVIWAKMRWDLFDDFVCGIGSKYSEWRSRPGEILPINGDFRRVGSPEIYQYHFHQVIWRSFEFWVELGYHF